MLTPLNAIINLSIILKKKYDKHAALTSDHQRRSSVVSLKSLYQAVSDSSSIMRIINNSAILMKYLVQDFLDLISIQMGSLKLSPKIESVTQLCSDVL